MLLNNYKGLRSSATFSFSQHVEKENVPDERDTTSHRGLETSVRMDGPLGRAVHRAGRRSASLRREGDEEKNTSALDG